VLLLEMHHNGRILNQKTPIHGPILLVQPQTSGEEKQKLVPGLVNVQASGERLENRK
jgi:hypothetical protein